MRALLASFFAVALPGLTGVTEVRAEPTDLAYARPAKLVDVGGFRLNLRCSGSGKPTVVFDVMATGSGHYIQFDRTPLVIDAIEDVIARGRRTRD